MFPTDTLQQKIEITDLKPLLAAENTSVIIILASTVYKNDKIIKIISKISNKISREYKNKMEILTKPIIESE